jgi:transcriptional regulator with XRE-family HTH domain
MKFSSEWLLRIANAEEDVRFSVGGWVSGLKEPIPIATTSESSPEARIQFESIFGKLINMARRERGLSVPELAERLGIAPKEILLLECGTTVPEPRIVSTLARLFDLPPRGLAQVAGHIVPDATTANAALAFAASTNTKPLDADQKEALHEFIKALSTI